MMFKIFKNNLLRYNDRLDSNENFKFLLLISLVFIGLLTINFINTFIGVGILSFLLLLTICRMLIVEKFIEFDRNVYKLPEIVKLLYLGKILIHMKLYQW
jgi:hypothetical protein